MIVYIKHQGAQVVRRGRTLQVLKEGGVQQTIFLHRTRQLVIMGHVELTPSAINQLCREKIDTVFLTINGRYKGRLETEESKNIFLVKRQFDSLNEKAFVLRLAQAIVAGKLANMATLLGRLKRRNQQLAAETFEKPVAAIRHLLEQVPQTESVESLRGYEGLATAHFFQAFRHGFKADWGFRQRIRRPPTDPVNAVLSFLYTLLYNRVYAAIRVVGLHPMLGYLHSLDYGRYSLALDLMEEFRSIVVETCVLSLFNLKILNKESFYFEPLPEPEPEVLVKPSVAQDPLGYIFENTDDGFFDTTEQKQEEQQPLDRPPTEKRPCRLRPEPLRLVIQAFEEKLATEFASPVDQTRLTYAEALVQQAQQLRHVLEGYQVHYQPLQLK